MLSHDEDINIVIKSTSETVSSVTDDKWTVPVLITGNTEITTRTIIKLVNVKDLKQLTDNPRKFTEKPLKPYKSEL